MQTKHQKALRKFFRSGVSRPVDPLRYPTNLAIILLTLAVASGVFSYRLAVGDTLSDAFIFGFFLAAGVFITWVVGRELDPDHNATAFLATGLTLIGLVALGGQTTLLPMILLIWAMRLVNRTTGLRYTTFDVLLMSAATALAGFTPFWALGGVLVSAFLLDWRLPEPHPFSRWAALGLALVTLTAAGLAGNLSLDISPSALYVFALLGLVFASVIDLPDQLRTLGDYRPNPLNGQRVRWAIMLVPLLFLLGSITRQDGELTGLFPAAGAFLALMLVYGWGMMFAPPR